MSKIATIIGARPQFVKAAVVSRALSEVQGMKEIIIHTGQHYDNNMSHIFFQELSLPLPTYQLEIGSASHGQQTGQMLAKIETVLIEQKPDLVLIYGDTNSTLAGALAAAKLHIPIAHIEAGLRSFNRKMPEEINRLVADQLSTFLFTPTAQAKKNLLAEGYAEKRIIEVGDVMYDAALFYTKNNTDNEKILDQYHLQNKKYILATIHRAENTDHLERLEIILTALSNLAKNYPVILPLHPRTRKIAEQHFSSLLTHSAMTIIEPIGFLPMIHLEKNASLIMTDSGGVQKEAYFYQVPCVTLREETEWVETVALNWNKLIAPISPQTIYEESLKMIDSQGILDQQPFGDGEAGNKIASYLADYFKKKIDPQENLKKTG